MNALVGLLVSACLGVDSGSAATLHSANYQPPGSPGGGNSWAGEQQNIVRWPSAPTKIPTSSPTVTPVPNENPRYAASPTSGTTTTSAWPASGTPIPTPVPTTASSTASSPPNPFNTASPSNNGYSLNTTGATPPPAGSTFPGSALGTLPNSTSTPVSTLPSNSTSAAWPTTTAPPSLGTGARVAQPTNIYAQPRENPISARFPAEPNLPTPNLGTVSNLGTAQNYNNYPQPTNPYNTQPNPWGNSQQVAQVGYAPPTANPAGPQFPQNNNVGQPGYNQNPQQQGQPAMNPNGATPGLVNNSAATIQKEPASASDKVQTKPAETPYLGLTLSLILLCTSLACNLYFGWSKYQMQERYRLLLVDRGGYAA
jgi:hypothetical protein